MGALALLLLTNFKIIGKKPFAPVGIRCDGSRICHNVDYSFQNGKCRDSEHRPRECHRNGCRRCVSVCYIMSAEEDPARRTQGTGNSGRLLLCLRSAGIRSGKLLFPHVVAVVTVISELIITLLLYWFLLLLLRCLRGQDFQYIPGGRLMRMLGKMFRL